jgi:uncharacterized membrane protein
MQNLSSRFDPFDAKKQQFIKGKPSEEHDISSGASILVGVSVLKAAEEPTEKRKTFDVADSAMSSASASTLTNSSKVGVSAEAMFMPAAHFFCFGLYTSEFVHVPIQRWLFRFL